MQILYLSCLLSLLLQTLVTPSLAWVANPKPNSARALSTTQLEMFDWFNKDKPTEKANTKEKETDFFSNFFK